MRDCSKCPHRAELHPEYLDADIEDIPCFHCEERDGTHKDALDAAHVEYNDEIRLDCHVHTRVTMMAEILDQWDTLSPEEKQVVRHKFANPSDTYPLMGMAIGSPPDTCRSRLNRAYKKIPSLTLL